TALDRPPHSFPTRRSSDLDQLRDLGIPVVTIDRGLKHASTDLIVADNVPAVRMATQRLIEAGHRNIAFVGGRSEVETGSERQERSEEHTSELQSPYDLVCR